MFYNKSGLSVVSNRPLSCEKPILAGDQIDKSIKFVDDFTANEVYLLIYYRL